MAQRVKTDWVLFGCILALVCFGLVMVYSASSVVAELKFGYSGYYIVRQMAWAVLGLAVMIGLMRLDYRRLNSPACAFASIGVVLFLLVVVYFVDSRAHRWLRLGPVGIQPSEFAKPALILFLAYFVALRAKAINNRHTLLPALVAVVPLAVAVVIADLGTAAVLVITAAVVFYVAGLEKKYIWRALIIGVICVGAAVAWKPYRMVRVFGFFDPEYKTLERFAWGEKVKTYLGQSSFNRDPGYHVRQSKIAVGSGGLIGKGLMDGKQKLFYLPEAHTDFIYAVVGEELGLLGCGTLVVLYLVILWRGLQLARSTQDDFGRYLAVGVTSIIVVQALMNMSVVLDMAPAKGIPLPMISYGGSSLLSTLILLGMLLSVSEQSG
ncbi:MAG TPA: putative lipid II flippase FtsW [Bryobacteraceae bacterium]|nr:putative lipid II flippase FtsW [Bryobacteraceae bacterium]HOL71345.1 putative lipid II flippase FtsW [Bryobacteraceae bacterium]HOQ47464.1 putative lipid II flippase FtsW [Bryobacteraceae bacterium]HPU74027.1 putative lipid II flippase FtsW [Bryobacteraceae bacterium]